MWATGTAAGIARSSCHAHERANYRVAVLTRRAKLAMLFGALAVALGVGLFMRGPVVRTILCDGSLPRWMLEAQDYRGGGCAEVLPISDAPPGADWSPYCLGMCLDMSSQEPLEAPAPR